VTRSYLSIGDVLTLLRQEFPDVTISKIRFLESQGLVNPERTPSGYRKFYDQDVERLRWVLRQQREHFLPLKVIKGRLEQEGEFDDTEPAEALAGDDGAEATAVLRHAEPVLVGHGAAAASVSAPASMSASASVPASASAAPGGSLPGFESAPPAPVPDAEMAAAPFAESAEPAPPQPAPARRAAARPAAGRGPGRAAAKAVPPPVTETAPVAEPTPPTLAGTGMTIEELAAATELSVGAVQQLESFGLLAGRSVGGVSYYDDDALAVARTAAAFAHFGVEARHLRLHKHAAEREAGFIEQIVLPLLKQRNPEARQKAHDNVTELTRLGQQLRAVLLRNALRQQLGG